MPQRSDHQVRTVLVTEGVAKSLVLLAKLSVGLSTGSTALLSEAVHSTDQSHRIADTIERRLSEQFKIRVVTVHIEPRSMGV